MLLMLNASFYSPGRKKKIYVFIVSIKRHDGIGASLDFVQYG